MADKLPLDKMIPVNIEGPDDLLDETLIKCAPLLFFPQAQPVGKKPLDDEENPYQRLIDKIEKIADAAQIPLKRQEIRAVTAQRKEIKAFVDDFYSRFMKMQEEILQARSQAEQSGNLLMHLRHMSGLDIAFERIFACRYIKARFGRLPLDSEKKLEYYKEHMFFFFPFARSGSYIWGAYFTTREYLRESDDIFSALFFERVEIPADLQGTPAEITDMLKKKHQQDKARYELLCEGFGRLMEEHKPRFLRFYNEAALLLKLYDTRRMASVLSDRFYLTGLCPKDGIRGLQDAVGGLRPDVTLEVLARWQAPSA